jgi:hypothetical protein
MTDLLHYAQPTQFLFEIDFAVSVFKFRELISSQQVFSNVS